MLVSLYRYNPETDAKPSMQDYELELPEGKDLMVLDVLELLKRQDPSISYRRSCREGVCGSDGMNINGSNGLACITPVSSVAKKRQIDPTSFAWIASSARLSGRHERVLPAVRKNRTVFD